MNYREYVPTQTQSAFHRNASKFKLYGGAMAGGKSVALCAEVIRLCLAFPGNSVLLARKTLKDLKRTTMRTLSELMPSDIVESYNKTDGIITLRNGSEIILSDLEYPDKLKSLNLGAFAIDEASETNDDVFLMLSSRLRKNISGIRYFGLMASNPEPGWLKDRFIASKRPDHVYIQALTKDNPYLPQKYLEDLTKEFPLIWRQKYLEGSWNDFGSQVFKGEWIRASEGMNVVIKYTAIDPAISEDEDADETSITTIGIGYDGNIHELETVHGRWSFQRQIAELDAVRSRHNPALIGIESVAYQKALVQVCTEKGWNIAELKADRDKVRRAIAVSNWFEQGKVFINTPELQRQLIEFPKGTHDDLVDSLVYAITMYKQYGQKPEAEKPNRFVGMNSHQMWFIQTREYQKKKDTGETNIEEFGSYQREVDPGFY